MFTSDFLISTIQVLVSYRFVVECYYAWKYSRKYSNEDYWGKKAIMTKLWNIIDSAIWLIIIWFVLWFSFDSSFERYLKQ